MTSFFAPKILFGIFFLLITLFALLFSTTSIYAYHNTPCGGKIFSISEDYIRLKETDLSREKLTYQLSNFKILPLKEYLFKNRPKITKEKLSLKDRKKKPFSDEDELFKNSKWFYFGKSPNKI